MCVSGGDWTSEKLSGRVQLEGHSLIWRVLKNFSFQPEHTTYEVQSHVANNQDQN